MMMGTARKPGLERVKSVASNQPTSGSRKCTSPVRFFSVEASGATPACCAARVFATVRRPDKRTTDRRGQDCMTLKGVYLAGEGDGADAGAAGAVAAGKGG